MLRLTIFISFVLTILVINTNNNNFINAHSHSNRLSAGHSLSMEDLVQDSRTHRDNRRERTPTARHATEPEHPASKHDEDGVQMPQIVGRGRHSWRHEIRRNEESKEIARQLEKKKVHPGMEGMSVERRAAHMLLGKFETRIIEQANHARSLLQMLQNANPHHLIQKKYAGKDKDPAEEALRIKEKDHYEKTASLESLINRLEYQLNDIKTFAEEVAKDSAASRETHKTLSVDFQTQLDNEKQKCADLIVKAEEKMTEVHADLNEKIKEIQQLKNTIDSLTGASSSSSSGDSSSKSSSELRLMLVQNAELVVYGGGAALLILFILGYLIGKSRGKTQGMQIAYSRKEEGYLFDGRAAGGFVEPQKQQGASPPPPPLPQYQQQRNNNNIAPGSPLGSSTNSNSTGSSHELKNRALNRFDGGI
jgi:hypothetical protein